MLSRVFVIMLMYHLSLNTYIPDFPYFEKVGLLLYLDVVSRPEIMYAVGVLTRHLKHPTYLSCKAASCVLNYLSRHAAMFITSSGCKNR